MDTVQNLNKEENSNVVLLIGEIYRKLLKALGYRPTLKNYIYKPNWFTPEQKLMAPRIVYSQKDHTSFLEPLSKFDLMLTGFLVGKDEILDSKVQSLGKFGLEFLKFKPEKLSKQEYYDMLMKDKEFRRLGKFLAKTAGEEPFLMLPKGVRQPFDDEHEFDKVLEVMQEIGYGTFKKLDYEAYKFKSVSEFIKTS